MVDNSVKVRAVMADRESEKGPQTAPVRELNNWRLRLDDAKRAWLTLDRQNESANTLSEEVIHELDEMLTTVEELGATALVIRSAKKGGFAAGADIRDFTGSADASAVEARMTEAHRIVDRLDKFRAPTIAVIHGHCLGGGLELALACDTRIAVSNAKLGFPEVMLGLHPGLGGTFRLPALIHPLEAMTMMLTGKTVYARKAKAIGLVDAVVEERHVEAAVEAAAAGKIPHPKTGWTGPLLNVGPLRRLAGKRMRGEAEKKVPSKHYPAPYRLIDIWERHGDDRTAMQKAELRSFAELLTGETAQNLIRVFFLREHLKGFGKDDSGIRHVHVIGAGQMGGDIATWCAARGLKVTLSDLDPKALAKAIGRANSFYAKKLHSTPERRDALDRLMPDFSGDGVARADLVIEAIAENADVKRKIFGEIAPRMKEGAILATNTSSIALEELRDHVPHPERLIGIHFFNPVTRMQLVEVISHDRADAEVLRRARAFCGDIDRLPAPVKSSPGFVVNRALTPYLAEAFLMLDEGIKKETIDRAATDFGLPMGPIELADQVGLDVDLEVARSLNRAFPDEVPEPPNWLKEKVDKGEVGRKSGKGLYDYDDKGKPRREDDAPAPQADIADRLILPMLNACVRLVREGVVEDANTLDAAMIFGSGFAPFRGGPLHYAHRRGAEDIVASLRRLEEKHGPRFKPDEGWHSLPGA